MIATARVRCPWMQIHLLTLPLPIMLDSFRAFWGDDDEEEEGVAETGGATFVRSKSQDFDCFSWNFRVFEARAPYFVNLVLKWKEFEANWNKLRQIETDWDKLSFAEAPQFVSNCFIFRQIERNKEALNLNSSQILKIRRLSFENPQKSRIRTDFHPWYPCKNITNYHKFFHPWCLDVKMLTMDEHLPYMAAWPHC